jgi:predicted RNA binding protein YcfA (HicA-like mRNA interferase family)
MGASAHPSLSTPRPESLQIGFYFDRQKGSHAIYKNNDGCRVVIPIHSGKDIKQGTLMGMIQDIGIDKETFFELLRK